MAIRAFVLIALLASTPAHAEVDVSVATGGVGGVLTRQASGSDGKISFRLGGIPVIAGVNFDHSEKWTSRLLVGAMMDIANRQVVRNGFGFALHRYLIGGAKKIERRTVYGEITSRYTSSLSLYGQAFLYNYSFTSQDGRTSISGSLAEPAIGTEYRQDLDSGDSVGGAVELVPMSLPAGGTRLNYSGAAFLLFWRHYF